MKKYLLLILSIMIIALFASSCKEAVSATTPTSSAENNTGNSSGDNNSGSGGDNNSGNGGTTNPDDGNQYPGDGGANGENSSGENLGKLYTVVTPKIKLDGKWGTEWQVRERDFDRMNMIWGQILKTYEGDNKGLAVVFGAGSALGFPGHPDLNGASSYTLRFYNESINNDNWNFKQPFNKYSTDGSPQVPKGALVKEFRFATLVQIEDDAIYKNTAWKGKYTIGAVYTAMSKNKYGGEQENQVQYAGQDEIIIIRSDCQQQYDPKSGVSFKQVQLLFDHNTKRLAKGRIYKFSDFGTIYNGPMRSIYMAAIPGTFAVNNHWGN